MLIGAKTNLKDFIVAEALSKEFDFLEVLYSKEQKTSQIRNLNCLVLHAPQELNLVFDSDLKALKEIIDFAGQSRFQIVIVHPGRGTEIDKFIQNLSEAVEFAREMSIELIIENMIVKHELMGKSPEEIKEICSNAKCGFCLDFSHAQFMSAFLNKNYRNLLNDFLKLRPRMFHLSDGILGRAEDLHLPLGEGNFDIKYLLSLTGDLPVTLECWPYSLGAFMLSKAYIKSLNIMPI